ncbi:MAG: surface protein [Flavipsychrobacter sp.]|nr:surface protein [Flavipsychrobacter sp.]
MKYFCLSLIAFALSVSTYAIGPIKGATNLCQGSISLLTDATTGGTWSSSATLIATVGSTGIVTALYPGTSIITYKAGTAKATTTVTVNATAPVTGTTSVCAGLTTTLSNAIYGGTWSSKDPLTATVTPGISNVTVNAIKAGTDTIFYTYSSGCTRYTVVNVMPLPAPITGSLDVCFGEKTQLKNATPNGVWSSSVPSIATIGIASGVASGLVPGTTMISYTGLTTCVRTAVLTVNPLPAPITGVTHAFQGNSTVLADATPGGTWSVNFPSIATIDAAGKVTGVSSGVATVFYKLTSTTGCQISTHYIVNGYPDSAGSFPISAWFPFCGDFTDHSTIPLAPNLIPVPPTSAPQPMKDRFGMANMADTFRGTDPLTTNPDFLRHNAFTTFTPTGNFTYSCWVKYDPALPQAACIMHNGIQSLNGIGFAINDGITLGGPGNLVSVMLGGINFFLPTDPYGGSFSSGLVNGWAHLYLECVITSSSSRINFFVNNINAGNIDLTQYPFNAPTTLFAVGSDGSGGPGFMGGIDDISIFNSSLTAIQRTETHMFNPDPSVFSLGPDVTMCTDSITLFPIPQIPGRIYTWSTGDTLNDVISVIPTANATTNYSLTISQPYGCSSIDAIDVTKNPLTVNIGVDTNICTGDTITIRVSPHHLGATYAWSTGETSDTIRAFSTGTYMVTVDSGVCRGHDSVFVAAQVTPLVDLGPDIFNCQGQPDTIENLYVTYDKGFTYLWSNGSNLETLVTNTSGSFWLQVTNNGCSRADSLKALIVVDTFSFYSKDTAICLGQFVTGQASFNPIVNYQWTPTTGVPLSTLPTTNITPDTTATYYLIGSYPGCPDIINSFHIDVQPYPKVFAGGNRHVCQFDTINIHALVSPNWYSDYRFSWSPGGQLDDSTRQTVIWTSSDTTNIRNLIVTVSTSANCVGSDSALIVTHPGNFDSLVSDISVCPGDRIILTPNMYYAYQQSGVTATYLWQPGKYVSDSNSSAPLLLAVTSEKFRTIGTSQYGCRDTFTFNVIVNPGAVIYLGDSVVLHPGETHQVNARTNADYFHWFPTGGVSDTNSSDPILNPTISTRYIVRAETEAGCKVVDSIDVRVDPSTLIDIPNAFSPGTGTNNILYVLKRGIATMNYFRIYDRWGVKLFETSNIAEGWDGTFNGKPQPFAVYVYEVEATTNTGKRFRKAGNVTLLR